MTATSVREALGKRDLSCGPLLEEKLAFLVEEEHAERSMKHALLDVGVQVAVFLGIRADHFVVFVHQDALFSQQLYLSFIKTGEIYSHAAFLIDFGGS